MSADNWATCPRCLTEAKAKHDALFRRAAESYGKVAAAEYERLREEAQTPISDEAFQTFREDYEIYGAEEGAIKVVYSGHCQVCKLSLNFKHEHKFFPMETTP